MADKKMTKKEALEIAIEFLGETECSAEVIEKLEGMVAQEVKRAEYSATHRKPAKAKGPSEETKAVAAKIGAILTDTPMTTAEINDVLGTDYTALRVSNAAKFIPGMATARVVRPTVGKNGLRAEKEYTAYFLA